LRLIEIIANTSRRAALEELLNSPYIIETWEYTCANSDQLVKVLVRDEDASTLLVSLEKEHPECRAVIYIVEGTLPKVTDEPKSKAESIKIGRFITISKEELYSDISDPVNLSTNFILMVVLSSFVAGIGILKESVPIVIGAMVIAPFLSPNMSLAFGTTLGDIPIIRKSIITGIVATCIAVAISVLWGYFTPDVGEVARDQHIEFRDLILALACGFAGVISVVSGQGTTLVGVMVAAALLPPLIRAGLLLGGGHYQSSFNSFLIFSANIICVNIAGITTFYSAGIRPQSWWEKEKAKKQTRKAMVVWAVALALLIGAIFLLQKYGALDLE
jgi:uncharacterized hydrophobic protein (TIGR00341 family)